MSASKGGQFEREICKTLSLWWTGDDRDDVFWRTSQSGGRATTRSKEGRETFGQYGDIQATDPIGQPLINFFCIELKKGYNNASFSNSFDAIPRRGKRESRPKRPNDILSFIRQAVRQCRQANSLTWMLIHRRDYRQTMIFIPTYMWQMILSYVEKNDHDPVDVPTLAFTNDKMSITQLSLQSFLEEVPPFIFEELKT